MCASLQKKSCGVFLGLSDVVTVHRRFPKGYGTEQSDNCKNNQYSCALLAAAEVSTSGFDHHGDGGAESDRASRAMETYSQGNHYPV